MVLGLETLADLPKLNANMQSLEQTIERMSDQLNRLHRDLEALTEEVGGLRVEMRER